MHKSYDSLYKEAQVALASILENEEREIIKAYGTAIFDIRKELKSLYNKYSKDGKLSHADLSKYNRLSGIQNQIENILNKDTSGVGPMIDKLTSLQREESFYRHGYAIDQAGTMNLKWGQFNEDSINGAVNNKLEKITATDLLEEAKPNFLNQIRNEISLSTIRGDSYAKLSKRIENILGVSVIGGKKAIYKNVGIAARALRIARTEGQRALVEGQLSSYQRAEDIGCEIEEVWDATLDKKTRPEHGELDGEIKDKKKKGWLVPSIGIVPAPLHSGVASFDIHCRCRIRGQVIGYPPTSRSYRDKDGKTQVAKYQTYKEWKAKQVKSKVITKKTTTTPAKPKKKTIKRNYNSQYAKKIGKEHYDNTHDIIDKCDNEKLKSIWEKYESQIKIADCNYKNCANYNPYYDHIKLDINKTALGNDYAAKYQTLFHETGHAIDHKIAMSKDSIVNKAIGYSNSYKDGLFPNTIEKEINDILLKYENDIRKEIQDHVTDYKWLYEKKYIDIFEYNDWVKNGIKPRKPRYKQRYAYHKLGEEIRNIPLDEAGNISDIIEGVTYGKVNVRIGHRAGYWKKRKDIITGRNNGVGLEAFAEMIDATFSNKKNLDMIKKYIPKSYDLFLKMIEEI